VPTTTALQIAFIANPSVLKSFENNTQGNELIHPRVIILRNNMTAAGLYVHIPFCSSRCSYCDFATGIYQSELAERYVRGLIAEIRSSRYAGENVDTIYFGGGTPSLLTPSQLDRILTTLHTTFVVGPESEITLEINPGSATPEKLRAFRNLGVNRASFGAQTFDDAELAKLGRSHSAADALRTFADLRDAGFANVSFDLIAGLPGQTLEGWQRNIRQALELAPEHLSFYLLEVHSGTPLAEHIRRGIQPQPDEDLAGVMYEWMLDHATAAGYEHYEISNLCQPGFSSRHNVKYWTAAPYYGFGCSAHSYDGDVRRWSNHRDVSKYLDVVEGGASAVVEEQQLTETDVRAEAVFLGMRMMQGVNLHRYRESFGVDLRHEHADDLERFCKAGLVELHGDLIRLTRTGALLSNEVFAAFV
jgi:putative oxygen-independent coproporphyrinogen III oxidase